MGRHSRPRIEKERFMAHIFMNSAVAVLIALAFVTSAISALRTEEGAARKVPVRIAARRDRNPRGRS